MTNLVNEELVNNVALKDDYDDLLVDINEPMTQLIDAVVAEVSAKCYLSEEQKAALRSRVVWRLVLLPE